MVPLSTAAIFAMIAFIVALALGVAIGRQILVHKYAGEALVANAINSNLPEPHVLLNNITLQTADATTQIDHVLVTTGGIFVIETKHYQGWIFGSPDKPQWTQTIYKKKSRFQNPILPKLRPPQNPPIPLHTSER